LLIGNGPLISTVDLDGRFASLEEYDDTPATIVGIDFDYR